MLGVLLVSGEFSQRTALTTLVLVPSRTRFVVTKTIAAVILAVVASVVTGIAALAATALSALFEPDTSWSVEPLVVVQLLVSLVIVVLVGVAFGLLCQNTPLGVVLYFVVPSLLTPVVLFVPAFQEVGGWIDLTSAAAPLTLGQVMDADQWARVATATALWFGLPFALGWLRFQRRDIA